MKNYKYSPYVLARVPLFDCQTAEKEYATILKEKVFKTALFFASRSFYNELSKKQFEYFLLSDKQKQTVKKYINRAIFRSTPFGLFAFVSLLDWGNDDEVFEFSEPQTDLKLDFATLSDLWERESEKTINSEQRFQSNASLYFSNIDFRYIKKRVEGTNAKFSVVSIEKNATLKLLLDFCRRPKTLEEILQFLTKRNLSLEECKSFIYDLIEGQILITNLLPNVTGPDYLHVWANASEKNSIIGNIEKQLGKKNLTSNILEHALSWASKLDHYFNKPESTNHFYCVSGCEIRQGSVNICYQKSLEEGLYCLTQLSQSFIPKDLQSFARAFVKKYETEQVPLLEALDAQFGIGYGGLDRIKVSYGFSSTGYNDNERNAVASNSQQNELAAWLIKEWQLSFNCSFELEITDHQLQHLKKKDTPAGLAPSISILFRTLGDKVFIESAGGVSALALIGRFCCFENIYQYAKTIAEEEQLQNNNIIFAEIAHLCNLHNANINRRPHFYDYEIPVLTNSILPEEKQIPLNDLMISVRDDKIILRSKRLRKIIVPRLSSAFNYTRNDLPIFRFLCDLQGQGIATNLNFSLSSMIPGLKFYPRLRYKSCILQLAEWHLDATELRAVNSSADVFVAFRQFAHGINLPRYFSYFIGDNFLVFDCDKNEDIDLFLKEVEHKKSIVLKEFPFLNGSEIRTISGGCLLPQYIATLVLQKEVYNFQQPLLEQNDPRIDTGDWIYFKLYCHPLSSDIILVHYLFTLIEKLKKENLLTSWFWVRYSDPDYHLRIRVRAKPKSRREVIQRIIICLDKVCFEKLASHFQTDRYKPELERYTPTLIEQVEDIFQTSSERVADWLREQKELNYEDQNVILNAVLSSYIILNAFEIQDQANLCKKTFEGFFTEFSSSKELKTEMERLHRQLEKEIDFLLHSRREMLQYELLIKSVKNLVLSHQEKNIREVSLEKLAMDMIHMHLNRLFIYNQRYFEMIHYYLLYRTLYKQLYKAIH